MLDLRGKMLGALGALILAFLVAGCGGGVEGPELGPDRPVVDESVPRHPTEVIVTSDDASLPAGCRPRPMAQALIHFFDAFNRNDRAQLSRMLFVAEGPAPPDFSSAGYYPWSWYSSREVGSGGRVLRHFTTFDQGKLLRYFGERHRQGERLRLIKVSVSRTGLLDKEDNAGFVFVLTRDARNLGEDLGGPSRIAYGRGGMNCGSRRIFAWSMDMKTGEKRTEREAAAWLCKDPPGWRPGEAVVACT